MARLQREAGHSRASLRHGQRCSRVKKAGERGVLAGLGRLRASRAAGGGRAQLPTSMLSLLVAWMSICVTTPARDRCSAFRSVARQRSIHYKVSPRPHPKIGAALVQLRKLLVANAAA